MTSSPSRLVGRGLAAVTATAHTLRATAHALRATAHALRATAHALRATARGTRGRRRVPAGVQDTVLAIFVAMMQVQGTLQVVGKEGVGLSTRDQAVMGSLLFGSGLILVARRRFPLTVFAVTGAASVFYYMAGYPDGPGWVALFVAVYTLAGYGDGVRSTRIALCGLAVLSVVWALTADLSDPARPGWLFFRIGTAVMAMALGESVRARRVVALQAQELAAQVQERAERAERTREQEARRRVDAERLRIAREVHDTVAHAIAIINVQAGVTAHVLDKRPERARDTLRTIEQTSARALRELRSTLEMLTDTSGDGCENDRSPIPGLSQLDELAGRARQAGIEVTVETSGTAPELPSALDSAAYRILHEVRLETWSRTPPEQVPISAGRRLVRLATGTPR
jgi:signal transduction histidine kinase